MLDLDLVKITLMPNNTDIDVVDILVGGNPVTDEVAWETDVENAKAFYYTILDEYSMNAFGCGTHNLVDPNKLIPYSVRKDIAEYIEYAISNHDPEFDEDSVDEDAYDDWLNEIDGDIQIGSLTYTASQVLSSVDPIAYRCGFSDYVNIKAEDWEYTDDYTEAKRGLVYISQEFIDWFHENNPSPEEDAE